MTTITLGVAFLVPRDFRQAVALEASLQAENAAWSGVEHALLLLKLGKTDTSTNPPYYFYELSKGYQNNGTTGYPHSRYYSGQSNLIDCFATRTNCPGLDRLLGTPINQEALKIEGPLKSVAGYYSLTIWHRAQHVGNISDGDLNDGITDRAMQQSRTSANINPILERDEVRRLDMRGVSSGNQVMLRWRPIERDGCVIDGGTSTSIVYTWLKSDGSEIVSGADGEMVPDARDIITYVGAGVQTYPITKSLPDAEVLSLRLLVTNNDESKVKDCFARYSLETTGDDTVDLGFDVIESTGYSAGVQRKIRVLVNRETGRPLNILDFGIVCGVSGSEGCKNL
jgi:hypothetical protein